MIGYDKTQSLMMSVNHSFIIFISMMIFQLLLKNY